MLALFLNVCEHPQSKGFASRALNQLWMADYRQFTLCAWLVFKSVRIWREVLAFLALNCAVKQKHGGLRSIIPAVITHINLFL